MRLHKRCLLSLAGKLQVILVLIQPHAQSQYEVLPRSPGPSQSTE